MPFDSSASSCLPEDPAILIGRVFRPDVAVPAVVVVRGQELVDISRTFPTVRDLCESPDPARAAHSEGESLGTVSDVLAGFTLSGASAMSRISRSPEELVRQTCGASHQYPDGFVLYMGTMFAPVEDRDAPGQGFTHHIGDVVTIASPRLGRLSNRVVSCPDAEPWTFGTRALMTNLAKRGLL